MHIWLSVKLNDYFYNTCVGVIAMGKCMCNKFINALIDQPVLGSVFITDFFLVFYIKNAHWVFTALMVVGLVAMSMYFGQKLQLFKIAETEEPKQAD
jgi:hypothetical protein